MPVWTIKMFTTIDLVHRNDGYIVEMSRHRFTLPHSWDDVCSPQLGSHISLGISQLLLRTAFRIIFINLFFLGTLNSPLSSSWGLLSRACWPAAAEVLDKLLKCPSKLPKNHRISWWCYCLQTGACALLFLVTIAKIASRTSRPALCFENI